MTNNNRCVFVSYAFYLFYWKPVLTRINFILLLDNNYSKEMTEEEKYELKRMKDFIQVNDETAKSKSKNTKFLNHIQQNYYPIEKMIRVTRNINVSACSFQLRYIIPNTDLYYLCIYLFFF